MNLNEYNSYISNEVTREDLIRTFELLYDKKLITINELQYAISLATERYKSINQLKLQTN